MSDIAKVPYPRRVRAVPGGGGVLALGRTQPKTFYNDKLPASGCCNLFTPGNSVERFTRLTAECRENVLEQEERNRLAKELQEGILYTVFNCIYLPRKWRLSRSI